MVQEYQGIPCGENHSMLCASRTCGVGDSGFGLGIEGIGLLRFHIEAERASSCWYAIEGDG